MRTCVIPADDWDCPSPYKNGNKNSDDENVLGIDNLEILNDEEDSRQAKDDNDEFLAVIDGDENLAIVVHNDDENSNFSGDGEVGNYVTPSAVTKHMITTQVQRLAQLVNKIAKGTNENLNADDLNSFLDRQKIQFGNYGSSESEKTLLPENGKIHPDVISEIINRQNNFKQFTTPMDKITTMRPFEIINKNPITEIKLQSTQELDSGNHQIVVNRPEGSVLFNVPATPVTRNQPYLSPDILKTILELSNNLVSNNQKTPTPSSQVNYQPQPVYYAIPVPIYQHQNYYGSNLQNYTQSSFSHPIQSSSFLLPLPTLSTTTTTTTTPKPKVENNLQNGYFDSFGNYYYYPQATPHKNYPSYGNYPAHAYQQYSYNPFYNNFYQQYPQNSYSGQNSAAFYEKRPFVFNSPAHSYVEHQKPFKEENTPSYDSGYESDDEESDDDLFDEPPRLPDPTDGLICTYVLARQANKTDCFKYYVCNAKTKEIIKYTCPPLTAFNDLTKFCDSSSYKDCKKMRENEKKNSIKNRRIVSEAQKYLAQAKRESQKAQRIASLMRKESQKFFYNQNQFTQPSNGFYGYQQNVYQPVETSTKEAEIEEEEEEEIEMPIIQTVAQRRTTTRRSQIKKKKKKSKRVKCTVLGAIADPEDEKSYWHCFKDPKDGRIKRIHRKCTGSLKFCAATRFCGVNC